jgi:hypothetical protein
MSVYSSVAAEDLVQMTRENQTLTSELMVVKEDNEINDDYYYNNSMNR